MLPLGTPAPDFELPDVTFGRSISPASISTGRPLLVMFLSRHCPFVQHVAPELARLGRDYGDRIGMVGIASNDAALYPDDAPVSMAAMAREAGFAFPVVFDESQEVAKAYAAACTPDFFLFDAAGRLAYRGQLDDSRPKNDRPLTGRDLRAAIDALLSDTPVSEEQLPSLGCNIKWREGNEPPYFLLPSPVPSPPSPH